MNNVSGGELDSRIAEMKGIAARFEENGIADPPAWLSNPQYNKVVGGPCSVGGWVKIEEEFISIFVFTDGRTFVNGELLVPEPAKIGGASIDSSNPERVKNLLQLASVLEKLAGDLFTGEIKHQTGEFSIKIDNDFVKTFDNATRLGSLVNGTTIRIKADIIFKTVNSSGVTIE
jgi:hypothetical protein